MIAWSKLKTPSILPSQEQKFLETGSKIFSRTWLKKKNSTFFADQIINNVLGSQSMLIHQIACISGRVLFTSFNKKQLTKKRLDSRKKQFLFIMINN